jgi:plastocyanin
MLGGGFLLTGCQDSAEPTVEMGDDMKYDPERLTVRAGERVTWRNTSSGMVHTATGDPTAVGDPTNVQLPAGAPRWDSGPIPSGGSWSHAFDVPGEYRYCCVPHELAGMVATIVVEP